MFKINTLPALPEIKLLSAEVVQVIADSDKADDMLSKAIAKAEQAKTNMVDLLIAEGFTSQHFVAPKGDEKDERITIGKITATRAEFRRDLEAVAICMIDAKIKADSEPDSLGLQWSAKEKRFHLRTPKLTKEQLESMSKEQKQKRTKLRQEIGGYMGALKRDLGAREAKETARQLGEASGDGKENGSDARAPHAKRSWSDQCRDFLENKIKQYKARDEAPGTLEQLKALEQALKAFK